MADFQYEIVEHIGVLSESPKGWRKELNKVSWNGGAPKYDIRDWAPEHEKMGKGVTLSDEELEKLKELIKPNDQLEICDMAKENSKTVKETVKTGVSFGSALAMVISYVNWHSIGWAILHGLMGWVYVIYYIIRYH